MGTVEFHGPHGVPALHCGRDFSPDAGSQTPKAMLLFWTHAEDVRGLPHPR